MIITIITIMDCIIRMLALVIYVATTQKSEDNVINVINTARLILLAGIVLVLLITIIAIVPAGHVGVLNTFGVVSEYELQSGLHFKLPWQEVVLFSIKTNELKETADTPSDEGLTVTLEVSILYRIDGTKAGEIFKTVGTNYEQVIIEPTFRSIVRGVTAEYDAKSLYTSQREIVASKIADQLRPKLKERGILIESVLLRSVTLPAQVRNSIERKLVADQEAQQMDFVLAKEQKEADRKVIEAKGIAEAQVIIDKSLTPQYLSWYWISHLADYNAVTYIPVGSNGMPLFKDVDSIEETGRIDAQ